MGSSVPLVLTFGLLASAMIVGVWDVYAWGQGRPADTVSAVMSGWARGHPIFPFAIGCLIGHIFWK